MAFDETMNNNSNTNTSLVQELINADHYHHDYDALSFCDLPMDNHDETDLQSLLDTCRENAPAGPTSEDNDDDDDEDGRLFEFLTSPEADHNRTGSIVFCGKTIVPRKEAVNYNKRSPIPDDVAASGSNPNRSSLFRMGFRGSGNCGFYSTPSSPATGLYSRGSSGSSPRRPKMELSEMRKRQQGRRSPARKFLATGSVGGKEGRSGRGRHHQHHHWGLLNPLRCGAYFMSALTKATFGLIPHV